MLNETLSSVLEKIFALTIIFYFYSKNTKYGLAICLLCIVFFIVKSKISESTKEGMAINIQIDNDDYSDSDDDEYIGNNDNMDKTVEIVVARYNENLEWLKHHPFSEYNVIIYNKGTNNNFYKPKKLKYIENLENVGKCDHTYLYHIIKNYDNLSDITIFLPGSCNMKWKQKKAKKMISQINKNNQAVILYNENMETTGLYR